MDNHRKGFKFKIGDRVSLLTSLVSPNLIFTIASKSRKGGEYRYKVKEEPDYNVRESIIVLESRNNYNCKHICNNCKGKCDLWESE